MATFRVGVAGDRWRQFFVCCVLLFSSRHVYAKDRATYRMIYQDISFASPCIRRTNATHQVGCTSNLNGNTGVIHLIENQTDIDWLQDKGSHAPYMAVFNADMFKRENIEKILKTGKVSGIVVDHSNHTRKEIIEEERWYSSDKSCPNQNFGLYNDTECPIQWNPYGDGTNFDIDFGVPVFALTHEVEVGFIRDCYFEHNHPNGTAQPEYPLCSMELDDFMFAVKDTPTCMWRTERTSNLETSHYCDPIGDKNVWGFAKNKKPDLASSPSIIIAATQIDATSLFYRLNPRVGSESVVSGFVPLLAAAEAIGKLKKEQKDAFDLDIMFTFFNGESYDYIGSSRIVYDMMRGYFPNNPEDEEEDKDKEKTKLPQINVTDIAYFLELKQLGLGDESTYYAHVDPISQEDEEVYNRTEDIIKILQGAGDVTVEKAPRDQPLPPASFQRFLKSGAKIPGVVLTDHKKEFKNGFYNSRYDIPLFLGIDSETWENDTVILPISEVRDYINSISS
ncbi:Nicastrin [Holothuria leucospilota]|uniref:Nicastrin n=1 Tax=Holothuria leucospilota TaxID=206669 RepID=A0A9Q1BWX4_HOLLE|nr:Nicastrin [Holothuria leucospilota]